MAIKHGFHC